MRKDSEYWHINIECPRMITPTLIFFKIIPDSLKSHTIFISEIKISKYIIALTRYNSKSIKLQLLYLKSDHSENLLSHRCLIQSLLLGIFQSVVVRK